MTLLDVAAGPVGVRDRTRAKPKRVGRLARVDFVVALACGSK
jgi:hypothetical protein